MIRELRTSAAAALSAALRPGLLLLALAGGHCQAQQRVEIASLDAASGVAVRLPAYWFAAPGSGDSPAVLALHGCGGLLDGRGQLAPRYLELAARLNALGIHMLATDSLSPRGERELCTQAPGGRKVTQLHRRRDALGGLQWLAAMPGVDPARIGLLGWSNGGSTVLAASNLRHAEVLAARVRPSLMVAFYPGCEAELARGYQPSAPLLLLLGEADDWTPAAPCKALAAAAAGSAKLQLESYPDAHHGFDGNLPLRLRRDVPGGVNPGAGVHVGANAPARQAAARRLEEFLRDNWALPR